MGLLFLTAVVFIWFTGHTFTSDVGIHRRLGKVTLRNETILTNDLLRRYSVHGVDALPLRNSSTQLTLWFGLRLVKMDINERSQTLTTSVWLRLRWIDEVLQWNPDDYGGVTKVMLPPEKIWTPDTVTVTNTFATQDGDRRVLLSVRHTGVVYWFPLRRYSSECLLDLTDYPYDIHKCTLWVQSLSWPMADLDLQPYNFNGNSAWDLDTFLESYKVSQPWEIVDNGTERVTVPRNAVILMWSKRVALKFTLTLKRRPSFISYMLRFPVIVLSFMAILIFCLPPDRPDRHMFAMSLFASFMILLLVLVDKVPPTAASIPKLIYVYCANLSVVICCIASSVMVIHVTRRGTTGHTPPKYLQKLFFEILAKVLFIHPGRLRQIDYQPKLVTSHPALGNPGTVNAHEMAFQMKSDITKDNELDEKEYGQKMNRETGQAKENHSVIQNTADKQWKLIALILDRIFAIIYLIINIVIVIVLFPRG